MLRDESGRERERQRFVSIKLEVILFKLTHEKFTFLSNKSCSILVLIYGEGGRGSEKGMEGGKLTIFYLKFKSMA